MRQWVTLLIILITELLQGIFLITSTMQIRPDGPSIDEQHYALNLIRGLSATDFGDPGLSFEPDGRLLPVDRPPLERHELVVAPD